MSIVAILPGWDASPLQVTPLQCFDNNGLGMCRTCILQKEKPAWWRGGGGGGS